MSADSLADARTKNTPGPVVTPCSTQLDLYLDPLLEEPPSRSAVDAATWRRYQSLVGRARGECSGCPLLVECLYKAVVQTDISGYVGCTTPAERTKIRKRLGVRVEAENFDAAAGARGSRRPVDHDDVLRARTAYPDDSLESLAQRLGCSLSTVKRHLRRARAAEQAGDGKGAAAGGSAAQAAPPTVEAVLDAFEQVVDQRRSHTA